MWCHTVSIFSTTADPEAKSDGICKEKPRIREEDVKKMKNLKINVDNVQEDSVGFAYQPSTAQDLPKFIKKLSSFSYFVKNFCSGNFSEIIVNNIVKVLSRPTS